MTDPQNRRGAIGSSSASYTTELDALDPGWANRIGTDAAQRIKHVTDGAPLYVPGTRPDRAAERFTPWRPAEVHRHPLNPDQLAVIPGWVGNQAPKATSRPLFVSVAHLAHRECPQCADIWTRAADHWAELDPSEAMIFARYEMPGRADLLVHIYDIPDSWFDAVSDN